VIVISLWILIIGIVVYCPITMDNEVGEYSFRSTLPPGYFCRTIAEHPTEIEITLRSSVFTPPRDGMIVRNLDGNGVEVEEVRSKIITTPSAARSQFIKELQTVVGQARAGRDATSPPATSIATRTHAVCTVQTFRNSQTGPMLYLFAAYHLLMGWSVIIYDRFGLHHEFIERLLQHPGMYYHPYTLYQLAEPTKYNTKYLQGLSFDLKYYYKMERNWGYSGKEQADTADQDQDKTRTYDYCRIEYAHLDSVFYVDADEFFYCPQASGSITDQMKYQQRLMNEFTALGVEEMR
jgi:hypothetical protein